MMEPTEVLRKALAAVEEAEVPDDLRELAFAKAVDLYTGTIKPSPNSGGGEGKGDGGAPEQEHALPAEHLSEGMAKVAEAFALEGDDVEEYFVEDEGGGLYFSHEPDSLGSTNVERVRAVSVIVGLARKVGGYDEGPTSIDVFRANCERLGIYDTNNFSSHVGGMTKWFNVNGQGRNRTFSIKPSGRSRAKELMSGLRAP